MNLGKSTVADRRAVWDARERAIRLARKHVKNAAELLYGSRAGALGERIVEPDEVPPSPSYWDFVRDLLDAALLVAERGLPDDYFATIPGHEVVLGGHDFGYMGPYAMSDATLEKAEEVVAMLKRRRDAATRAERIAKLEDVAGRTPEEAALYLAKAADLRARSRGGSS